MFKNVRGRGMTPHIDFKGIAIYAVISACIVSIACVFLTGCHQHADTEQEAVKVVLARLSNEVASNLVQEASLWIREARTQPVQGLFYRSKQIPAPTALRLGSDVWVERDSQDEECMIVQVPVSLSQFRSCEVYVKVKPGENFTNSSEYIKYSNNIVLRAKIRD